MNFVNDLLRESTHRDGEDEPSLDATKIICQMIEQLAHALCQRYQENGLAIFLGQVSCPMDEHRGLSTSRHTPEPGRSSKVLLRYLLLLRMEKEHPIGHRMVREEIAELIRII